jgi:beta-lactamase regulating signal transducer with metallopeptidase domain
LAFFARWCWPESFLALEDEAKLGVACHELLHVRRNDWLITLIEEFVGSLLWFHPAIWWVLGQTRLARNSWSTPKSCG